MLVFLALACHSDAPSGPSAAPPPEEMASAPAPTGSPSPSGIVPGVDPGAPSFPEVVDTVSVTVTTKPSLTAGTDDAGYLCLQPSADPAVDCLPLRRPDVDDLQRGSTGVYHFPGQQLSRSQLAQVSLHLRDGGDAWQPQCLAVQLDGEPVHCRDDLDVTLGDGDDEQLDWVDPDGLRSACTTCFGAPLTHGPMVGAVEPDRARVVVRTDATRQVALYVSETPDVADAVVAAYAYPSPDDDYTATLVAEGTAPATDYWYAVGVDGQPPAPSASGQFTTPPLDGTPGALRIAMGSCTKTAAQPIFATVDAADPDLFLFLGDNHYGNTGDLDALRHHYRWAWERPPRAELLAHTPTLATWDDHDFVDNNSYGADHAQWPAVERDHALKAFSEYWGNPSAGTVTTPGVFFTHTVGDVELFVLDGRYHRDDPADVAVPTYLGADQLHWLLDALDRSTATFKILATGSMWSPHGSDDSWAAYPDEWDELFAGIADRHIDGVVLASGDVHRSELRLVDNPHGYDLPEFVASSLASPSPSPCLLPDDDLITCVSGGWYFTVLDIDTAADDPTITATIVDLGGAEQARWTVHLSELSL